MEPDKWFLLEKKFFFFLLLKFKRRTLWNTVEQKKHRLQLIISNHVYSSNRIQIVHQIVMKIIFNEAKEENKKNVRPRWMPMRGKYQNESLINTSPMQSTIIILIDFIEL